MPTTSKIQKEVNMRKFKLLFTGVFWFIPVMFYAQTGLVAHWSFDEITDSVFADHSGFDNFGTVYGAELVEGIKGNALFFDGVDDYARIPADGMNAPSVLSDLETGSLSVWFRVDYIPTQIDGIAPIFYYGAEENCDFFDAANKGFIIEVGHTPLHNGSERLYYTFWKDGCTYPSLCFDSHHAIQEGIWQHFVVIVGENFNTGYLNGQEMTDRWYNFGSSSLSQFFADALVHEKLWLGKGYWDDATMHFDGAIDEIKIFDRVLTPSEVQTIYQDTTAPTAIFDRQPDPDQLTIFPNPARESIRVEVENSTGMKYWHIYDVAGKIMTQGKYPESGDLYIKLESFNQGIYFFEAGNNRNQLKKKFIVQ